MVSAVFLDRDGVINELVYHQEKEIIDSPFLPHQFRLIPGVPEAIVILRQNGYLTVLASNQPSIGNGNMSPENFEAVRNRMRTMLADAGTQLDGEYYCLHHPEAIIEKYRVKCDCRKPKSGLLLKAAQDMNIDLSKSWMVGDNLSDIQAGKNAGCRTILIGKPNRELYQSMDTEDIQPEAITSSLREAVAMILGIGREQSHPFDEKIQTSIE